MQRSLEFRAPACSPLRPPPPFIKQPLRLERGAATAASLHGKGDTPPPGREEPDSLG